MDDTLFHVLFYFICIYSKFYWPSYLAYSPDCIPDRVRWSEIYTVQKCLRRYDHSRETGTQWAAKRIMVVCLSSSMSVKVCGVVASSIAIFGACVDLSRRKLDESRESSTCPQEWGFSTLNQRMEKQAFRDKSVPNSIPLRSNNRRIWDGLASQDSSQYHFSPDFSHRCWRYRSNRYSVSIIGQSQSLAVAVAPAFSPVLKGNSVHVDVLVCPTHSMFTTPINLLGLSKLGKTVKGMGDNHRHAPGEIFATDFNKRWKRPVARRWLAHHDRRCGY